MLLFSKESPPAEEACVFATLGPGFVGKLSMLFKEEGGLLEESVEEVEEALDSESTSSPSSSSELEDLLLIFVVLGSFFILSLGAFWCVCG